jgi:hypothetical protein
MNPIAWIAIGAGLLLCAGLAAALAELAMIGSLLEILPPPGEESESESGGGPTGAAISAGAGATDGLERPPPAGVPSR